MSQKERWEGLNILLGISSHWNKTSADIRTRTYPAYLGSHAVEQSTAPRKPNYPDTSSLGMDYLQVNHSTPEPSHSHLPTTTIEGPQAPVRQQYPFKPSSVSPTVPPVCFIDSNPRPAKSTRHVAPQDLPSIAPYTGYEARFAPPYAGPNGTLPQREPGYFPTSAPMQAWTTAADTGAVYGTAMQTPTSNIQHYQFHDETYVKEETSTEQNYMWNAG